jgi:hypothetical protein
MDIPGTAASSSHLAGEPRETLGQEHQKKR